MVTSLKNSLIPRLLTRLKPFWPSLAIYAGITFIYELLQLGGSYSVSAGIRFLLPFAPVQSWIIFIAVLILYKLILIACDSWLDWTIIRLLYGVEKYLNIKALDKFLEMRLSWHHVNNSGALVGKVHHGTDKTIELLGGYLWEFVPTLIQAITNTAALFLFGWPIVAVAYFMLAIFLKLTLDAYRARRQLREQRHDLYEKEWARFVEAVQGIQEIISTNQGARTLEEYSQVYEQINRLGLAEARISTFSYNPARNVLVSIGDTAILVFLLYRVSIGKLTTADLFFVWTVVQRLFYSFWRIARLIDRTGEASEGFLRFDTLMNAVQALFFSSHGTTIPDGSIGISIRNVEFGYNGTDKIIDNFSLDIPAGKVYAIVGASGSGKSTLAKAVKGFWPIRSGQILFNGQSMYDLTESQLHDLVAIVNQADNIFIFEGTIRANLLMSKPDATFEDIVQATTIANLHAEILAFPNGYDTLVGEKGIHLSGGQKQRLAIARAVLRNPRILILDEPTSGLDLENETIVKQAIFQSAPGRTTLIIAHRLVTIRDADCIVVMENGQIVEQGTHTELLALNGAYAHLHQLDQKSLLDLAA